jgi:cell division protein FtsN
VKDFATKRARVDGQLDQTKSSQGGIPIGRWILLVVTVLVMIGYTLWNHHRTTTLSKQKPPSNYSASHSSSSSPGTTIPNSSASNNKDLSNSKKNKALSTLAPPPVQFDFYHVLANDSGNGQPRLELLKPSPNLDTPDSSSLTASHQEKSQISVTENTSANTSEMPTEKTSESESEIGTASTSETDKASSETQLEPQVNSQASVHQSMTQSVPSSVAETVKAPKPQKVVATKAPAKAVVKVSPKTVLKPAPSIKTEVKMPIYDVQVATFLVKDRAESMRGKLMLLGFEPKISAENGRYLLHFGLIKNLHSAETLQSQLEKSGITSSIQSFMVLSSGIAHGE